MQSGYGDGEGIRRIGIQRLYRQQPGHHGGNLALVGAACADDRFFHLPSGNFGNIQTGIRALHHDHAAGHAQLQRRGGRAGDKNLFDGGAVWPVGLYHRGESGRDHSKPVGIRHFRIGLDNTVGEVNEDQAGTLIKLLDTLDDNDDVQNVSSNFDISDEIMARLA